MNCIYQVTEKNVDSCRSDAAEFVLFHKPLNQSASALFARALKEAKEKAGEDERHSRNDFQRAFAV